jgi:hypothetical protein
MFLLECGGRAYVANLGPFRAEEYGMVTILQLVFHIRYFYFTRNLTLRFTLLCDSKSLLDQLTASKALTRSVPRRCLGFLSLR